MPSFDVCKCQIETDPVLPSIKGTPSRPKPPSRCYPAFLTLIVAGTACACTWLMLYTLSRTKIEPFYSSVRVPKGICNSDDTKGVSHAGYIGLKGDSENNPKRSFFWYFEAQEEAQDAPVILSIGGGPGSSGLLNPMFGQSHCILGPNATTKPNPNPWTERFNLLALDHPIGVGLSYGAMVNNSRTAAYDVYDFLQKFYSLYPHLVKNPFVVSAGSYGGTYVPHIATVIHEQNHALALGRGQPGAVHINLESLMLSNPYSDTLSHYRWLLQQRCYNTNLYNSTTCSELFQILPACLEKIEFALENPSVDHRVTAIETCVVMLEGDTHGVQINDVRMKCDGPLEECFPEFIWVSDFFNSSITKRELGVPDHVQFEAISEDVFTEFWNTGDLVQQPYRLYEPLLKDGIRVLHYVGAQDCNCAWPGVFSFLKLLRTPFQQPFINAPDVPWHGEDATVRVVGEGAGSMTYILVTEAGHFVEKDQPMLVKDIVEHWIDNRAFV